VTGPAPRAPEPALRALGLGWLLLAAALAMGGLELWVRLQPPRPGDLVDRLHVYQQRPQDPPHLVAFGTCLGDALVPAVVEASWGAGVEVDSLTSRASTSLDWYLVMAGHLDQDPALRGIIVTFGLDDLSLRPSPWESQIMNLARWQDLPLLVRDTCSGPGCALELLLRRASMAYRYRGGLGYRLWAALGTRPPGARSVPARGPGPGNTDSVDGVMIPTGLADPGKATEVGFGWHSEGTWLEPDTDPYLWVRRMLALGQARGLPMYFVPLPANPTFQTNARGWADPDIRARTRSLITEGGGQVLDLGPLPDLDGSCFQDDVHFTAHGGEVMSRAIGQALATQVDPATLR